MTDKPNDLFDVRVGRLSVTIFFGRPFIRAGWNRNPRLLTSFGWFFIWWRGKKKPW